MKNILIIEDDKSILDAMRMALEFEGYSVTVSDRGDYAHVLLSGKSALPDGILLDILLSGMDGRVICTMLKDNAKTKHIPIIMMSAHPHAEKSVYEAGADYFLSKPFAIDDLLGTVHRFV
jgi:DNA-binding response OmpR family regulator